MGSSRLVKRFRCGRSSFVHDLSSTLGGSGRLPKPRSAWPWSSQLPAEAGRLSGDAAGGGGVDCGGGGIGGGGDGGEALLPAAGWFNQESRED